MDWLASGHCAAASTAPSRRAGGVISGIPSRVRNGTRGMPRQRPLLRKTAAQGPRCRQPGPCGAPF
eukprot:9056671-Alexandrium_andersonii.AAC.1